MSNSDKFNNKSNPYASGWARFSSKIICKKNELIQELCLLGSFSDSFYNRDAFESLDVFSGLGQFFTTASMNPESDGVKRITHSKNSQQQKITGSEQELSSVLAIWPIPGLIARLGREWSRWQPHRLQRSSLQITSAKRATSEPIKLEADSSWASLSDFSSPLATHSSPFLLRCTLKGVIYLLHPSESAIEVSFLFWLGLCCLFTSYCLLGLCCLAELLNTYCLDCLSFLGHCLRLLLAHFPHCLSLFAFLVRLSLNFLDLLLSSFHLDRKGVLFSSFIFCCLCLELRPDLDRSAFHRWLFSLCFFRRLLDNFCLHCSLFNSGTFKQ